MSIFKWKDKDTETLKEDVEKAFDKSLCTPKDFELLRETIYRQQHIVIGLSTLLRLWNYIEGNTKPRKSTLDILAKFLGYKDFADYSHIKLPEDSSDSNAIMARGISVSEQLTQGDRLELTWRPDRVCVIEYMGNNFFRIIAAEKTHLHVGDTFSCESIIEGKPLYLDNLHHDGMTAARYVCGKTAGIKFELLTGRE